MPDQPILEIRFTHLAHDGPIPGPLRAVRCQDGLITVLY